MFRFTIRDVLWLTALVAVCVVWWLLWSKNASLKYENGQLRERNVKLFEALRPHLFICPTEPNP